MRARVNNPGPIACWCARTCVLAQALLPPVDLRVVSSMVSTAVLDEPQPGIVAAEPSIRSRRLLRAAVQSRLSASARRLLALDDPLNDEVSSQLSGMSGFLK